ncbi:RNA polymerase sigma factor [Maridesulfovibrio bastinii]|uniref:RNA polymerase sigma factor n=1 Tax=Maridesulfovibrio bastinii TaxID=47157 RepID=UPI0004277C67|nr:sigma-70 family RNA polymerase sigma factor [Maridesulfovibrio bastinii]
MGGPPSLFKKDIFWKRYKQLQTYLRKKLSPEDVEDVIQTALYKLVKADQLVFSSDWILAWLYRVVRNESIDLMRKKKPVPFADELSDFQNELYDETLGIMLPDNKRPEDEMLRKLFWEELESAMNDLPEAQRDIFIRTELNGESFKKISEETDVPVGTLISRKRYAVLRLRERLERLKQEIVS